MISPTLDTARTFLHLLGVAIWLGGQIVLGAIVPKIRATSPQTLPLVAKAFARIAWPSLILIVFTGAWGLSEQDVANQSTEYMTTLMLKLLLVGAAVISTIIHSVGTSKLSKALGGALGLLFSVTAAYAGVLLAHAA